MNTHRLHLSVLSVASSAVLLACTPALRAQVSLTGSSPSYTQNFLVPTGDLDPGTNTWTDNSTLAGWYAVMNGSTATQYKTTNSNGQNGLPGLYLFRTGVKDAALGTLRNSGNTGFTAFGVQLVNNTGETITSLNISYYLQQWQLSTGTGDGLDFQYAVGASSLTDTDVTWVDDDALDGNALKVADTAPGGNSYVGYANGPTIDNSIVTSSDYSATSTSSITGLSLAAGQTIWLRWVDRDISGTEHALSIDNFTLSASTSSIPEPSAIALLAGSVALAVCGCLRFRRSRR